MNSSFLTQLQIFRESQNRQLNMSRLGPMSTTNKNVNSNRGSHFLFGLWQKWPLVGSGWFVRSRPLVLLVVVGRVVGNTCE